MPTNTKTEKQLQQLRRAVMRHLEHEDSCGVIAILRPALSKLECHGAPLGTRDQLADAVVALVHATSCVDDAVKVAKHEANTLAEIIVQKTAERLMPGQDFGGRWDTAGAVIREKDPELFSALVSVFEKLAHVAVAS